MTKNNGGMVDGRIVIDARDWLDLYNEHEPDMTGDEPLIDLAMTGIKPKTAAPLIVIAGEKGELKDYPGSKALLGKGGAMWYNAVIGAVKRNIALQNGKSYEGRAYVAPVKEDEGTEEDDQIPRDTQLDGVQSSVPVQSWLEEKVIKSSDPAAVERAIQYLLRHVQGVIWNRLLIIAEHEPERLTEVADQLKDKIDEMVERLS